MVVGTAVRPLTAVAVAVLASLLLLARGDAIDPHGKLDRCESCHADRAPEGLEPPGVRNSGTAVVSYPLRAARETSICGVCHEVTVELAHPVDISPRFPVPRTFPLDARGHLVCGSCHDPHTIQGAWPDSGPSPTGNSEGVAAGRPRRVRWKSRPLTRSTRRTTVGSHGVGSGRWEARPAAFVNFP